MQLATDNLEGPRHSRRILSERDLSRASDCVLSVPDLRLRPIGNGVSLAVLHESGLERLSCHSGEMALLRENMAPKRRKEFALGRSAARLALRRAGNRDNSPVLQRDREPIWPCGFVGSITHCESWAIAAAVKADVVKSIGIDLENAEAIRVEEIIDLVSTKAERIWVLRNGNAQLKLASVFSAKEAAYKALFPLCRQFFDFQAIDLAWCPERQLFRGTLRIGLRRDLPAGYELEIGCQRLYSFIFTHTAIAN